MNLTEHHITKNSTEVAIGSLSKKEGYGKKTSLEK